MITSGFRSRTSFHAQLFTLISIVILLIHPLHHVVSASSDATSVATEAETMMDKNSAEGASPPEHTDDASPSTTTPPGAAPVQEGAQLARARFVAGKDMTPFPDPVCAKDPGRNLRCIYEGFDATTKHCNPRTMTIDNRTLSRALFFSCLHGSDGRCCTDPCYPRTINQCSGDQCIWVQYGTSGRCVSYHKLCWGSRSKQECENVAFCHWTPSKNDMESAKSEEKPGTDTEGTCEFYPPRQLSCGGVTFDSPDAETLCGSAIPGPMKALLALTGIAFAVAIAAIAYVIYRRIKKPKAVRGDISIGQ